MCSFYVRLYSETQWCAWARSMLFLFIVQAIFFFFFDHVYSQRTKY